MIMDTQETFSGSIAADGYTRSGQAITASALSTNVLDRSGNTVQFPTLEDEGLTAPDLYFVAVIPQAFNNLTSLQIELISDSNPNLTTAPVSHYTKTIALAQLTAGARVLAAQLPSDDYKRYIGVRYTVTGTAPTTGTVWAFFTLDINRNVIYPTNYSVDV